MKKINLFVALLFAASSLFAQTAGDMFISGSLNLGGSSDGSSDSYTYEYDGDENMDATKINYPVSNLNFSISPEFGYFVADNCLLKIGLGYEMDRLWNEDSYDLWENEKAPKNPLYKKYGKYWDNEDEEWEDVYGVPFYDWKHLFTIRPAFHYYVAITENFYYTPGVSLTLGFGSYKSERWQSPKSYDEDYEEWDGDDYEDYLDNRKKECPKEYTSAAFRFGLNLHLLAFEFRPAQNFGITLSAGEFGYVYDSRYQNFNEDEMEELFDEKDSTSKEKYFTNNFGLNLNLGAKIGFSYYF